MAIGTAPLGTTTLGEGRLERPLPAPPGFRLGYDLDGTTGKVVKGSLFEDLVQADLAALNDEDQDGIELDTLLGLADASLVLLLPYTTNLTGIFVVGSGLTPGSIEVSSDTTDGIDGTWSTYTASWSLYGRARPDYRFTPVVDVSDVKGIRFNQTADGTPRIESLHLYGERTDQTDRLVVWDPDFDSPLSAGAFNFGVMVEGQSAYTVFRLHSTAARSVYYGLTLSSEEPSPLPGDPPVISFSWWDNGHVVDWYSTMNIGDLLPGETSRPLVARIEVVTEYPSPHALRIRIEPEGGASVPYTPVLRYYSPEWVGPPEEQ